MKYSKKYLTSWCLSGLVFAVALLLAGGCSSSKPGSEDKSADKSAEKSDGKSMAQVPIEKEGNPLAEFRARNRLYPGAPPTITHNLEDISEADCNDCHAPGSGPDDDKKPLATPHETRENCLQCHVAMLVETEFKPNLYAGAPAQKAAAKANPLGPPYIPHRIQDRSECAICHLDVNAPESIVPGHKLRTNCTQCHVQLQQAVPSFPPG